MPRICSADYVPDIDDLLRVRQPTTSILEYKFKLSGTYFLFVDVGGQRSERRKWINCFENVTSLLFVASLSDYDLTLSKDELRASNTHDLSEHVNRMRDALDLFRTLINWKKKNFLNVKKETPCTTSNSTKSTRNSSNSDVQQQLVKETLLFENVSIILFLNKEDLFEEKFKLRPLTLCFDDFKEETNTTSAQAKEFIARKFIECDKSSFSSQTSGESSDDGSLKSSRDIYWHYTFALDRKNIETVVASVKDKILQYMLESMRL